MMDTASRFRRRLGCWRCTALLALLGFCCTLMALVVQIVIIKRSDDGTKSRSFPCPASKQGLVTSGDPQDPGPFHDITIAEYERVYRFLRQERKLNLTDPKEASVNTSNIFIMDLLLPAKERVLNFLDNQGPQPDREARVMIFRGDKVPPVVEEYRVGPLSQPSYAELILSTKSRNPVPFSVRPLGSKEYYAIMAYLMPTVDQKVGHILTESYGGKYTDCGDNCLITSQVPLGTQLEGAVIRKMWMTTYFRAEYYMLYPVDFSVLLNLEGSDPAQWSVEEVWYSGTLYQSLEDLADKYANDPAINKTRLPFVHNSPDLKTAQRLRGDPAPESPQRAPVQIEPDGKRYSLHHRHVTYLHWDFDIRLSPFTGPQVYDVRYQGDRIAYELGVSEIAVYYSGNNPMQRVTDFVDSTYMMGTYTRTPIPGVDCPDGATFLNASFFGEGVEAATTLARAQCVFEQNTGVPLRRHVSYSRRQGAFSGGMADSVLIVRSILILENYDYIIDYVFHQNGALETRAMSTGYIMSTFYQPEESPYGFPLDEHMTANIHHHMFNFKVDLDISGTSNRYETLDISEEEVQLRTVPGTTYRQTKFQRHLYNTEDEAVYKFNFDKPRYHIVHNEQKKTKYGVPRAFRLHLAGMSKQLLTANEDNEKSIAWARQQLAVTVHKDDETVSSSPYAHLDSLDPVTDFQDFIDGESIVDQDLVFWVTMGTHHIPHTEDIPITTTPGGHLAFFLLPYNYFPECPSTSSRDNIRVEYVTANKPADGLKVERNGNEVNAACGKVTLEQLVKERPDDILQTYRDFTLM